MIIVDIFIYIVLGIVSGLLAGLLGIGGGIVTVPCLLLVFYFFKFETVHLMHYAVGTSLAIILVSSCVALFLYQKKGAVRWPILQHLLPGLIIGSFAGVVITNFLSSNILIQIFGYIAFLVGVYLLFSNFPKLSTSTPKKFTSNAFGLLIGCLATLLGIGGGVIATPILAIFYKVSKKSLIGTASATTFFSAIIGTISYLFTGSHFSFSFKSIGYIYLPAFLVVGLVSSFFVSWGIKIADNISKKLLKRIFALVLIATATCIIFL